MRKCFFPLLTLLLLTGCASQQTALPTADPEPAPGFSLTQVHDVGGVEVFVPSDPVSGILPLGEGVLVIPEEGGIRLASAFKDEEAWFSTALTSEKVVCHSDGKSISFFHGEENQTLVLDESLTVTERIDAPEGLAGSPVLSGDGRSLWYRTADSLRCYEVSTGISRLVRQGLEPDTVPTGTLMKDTVLVLKGPGQCLFLSAETGALLASQPEDTQVRSSKDFWCADLSGRLFFGWGGDAPAGSACPVQCDSLLPCAAPLASPDGGGGTASAVTERASEECALSVKNQRIFDSSPIGRTKGAESAGENLGGMGGVGGVFQVHPENCVVTRFLPEISAALTLLYPEENQVTTELYDLNTGIRTASVTFPAGKITQICGDTQKRIWLLDEEGKLYRWDPARNPVTDDRIYTAPCLPASENEELLLQATESIRERFGITVEIGTGEAYAGYLTREEPLLPALQQSLTAVEGALEALPEGFLDTLTSPFGPLKITLFRSILREDTKEALSGALVWEGQNPHILLSIEDPRKGLYRKLSILAETTVLVGSTAYDRWSGLNPRGFSYQLSYGTDERMTGEEWLRPGREAFLNADAMRSSQEDRAEVFAYAMTEGNGRAFTSPCLQEKLAVLCKGLREGFDLGSCETLPWERYLR